ncbi:hypothetical protein ADL15_50380 [Actinoplanes awajinensis subsp. mycoplanecinus]|uniref:Uncharacterized protein n=1 Tax=Actinoplanes awajinensis subsp. mycoplanecinus TaxID=135947 RepID=A0A124G740_9ACTN|nr:hypothetical protein ADL15_50380 [Actinoplanes awajinensis subsp. mycoplanecinus]
MLSGGAALLLGLLASAALTRSQIIGVLTFDGGAVIAWLLLCRRLTVWRAATAYGNQLFVSLEMLG